ncbi:MAG: hypothetical protein KF824_09360 [Fimbriimonadaceae bacterium]|nr:MAG: hypothetical protein KF824_09360 [Fimbriimonadaceae bacterium]
MSFARFMMQEFALRKWWILLVAGSVVVGCAGGTGDIGSTTGGSGSSGSSGSTGAPTRSVPTVNFPSGMADVRVVFLTGQNRRVPGSLYAKINNVRFSNSPVDIIPTDFTGSLDGLNLHLDGYGVHKYSFGQALPTGVNSKTYTSLSFDVWNMYEEQLNGSLLEVFSGLFPIKDIPVTMPILSGRQTTLAVYLNNASLSLNAGLTPVFDEFEFNFDNLLDINPTIEGSLSDMISFDISSVASRPSMAGGGFAGKFMVSGDGYGLGQGFGFDGSFDLFSPNFIESGVITDQVQLPDGVAPGTYTVLEPDPQVIPPAVVRITSLQGSWRDVGSVVTNLGTSSMIIFPTTKAGGTQTAVLLTRSGSTITGLYFGNATITSNGGSVTLWPVDQAAIAEGSRTGAFTGTFSNLTKVGGVTKDGDYALTGAPGGVPDTGVFVIYAQ